MMLARCTVCQQAFLTFLQRLRPSDRKPYGIQTKAHVQCLGLLAEQAQQQAWLKGGSMTAQIDIATCTIDAVE